MDIQVETEATVRLALHDLIDAALSDKTRLTDNELVVFLMWCNGHQMDAIQKALGVSRQTVSNTLYSSLNKLSVATKVNFRHITFGQKRARKQYGAQGSKGA